MSQSQGAYVKQQLHSVINQYLSRFLPATPSIGAVVNHPVLLAACESNITPQGERLRRSILQVLRYLYISLFVIAIKKWHEMIYWYSIVYIHFQTKALQQR